ncbi:E3 SUMO-protein ligase pli1 [Clonorchis sinensis]|uniref:E3 SUMO-protein ligase pli1 n=1 Tax=Clonorchis sinensis TaxID=79923 RepID=G7YE01_CLOSI|nr:E3 SUMO-protein ligase pli1 [Clonorchis sinensis]
MSGQNFPNGQIGPGFSFNIYRPPVRPSTGGSAATSQSSARLMAQNRGALITCFPTSTNDGQTRTAHSNHGDKLMGKCGDSSAATTTTCLTETSLQKLVQSIHFLTASPTIPNLTVIPTSGVIPSNATVAGGGGVGGSGAGIRAATGGFQPHAVLNNLFQSLLRGQVPVSNTTMSTNLSNNSTNNIASLSMPPANVSGYLNTVAPAGTGSRFPFPSKPSPTLPDLPPSHTVHSHHHTMPHQPTPPTLVHSVSTSTTTGNDVTNNSQNSNNMNTRNKIGNNLPPLLAPGSSSSSRSGSNRNAMNSVLEALFNPINLSTVSIGSGKSADDPKIQKLSSMSFLRWASACTRSFRRDRVTPMPHTQADIDALHSMNWVVAPTGLLGIYSESPFLRPVLLLRRVQFATPGTVVTTMPDPDNMVRALREMAFVKVTKLPTFAQNPPRSPGAVGFTTDFLSYVFTLDLDRLLVKILSAQLKNGSRQPGPEWRVILRLGWATNDFYVPSAVSPEQRSRVFRALTMESLPRCLNVRVAGRVVQLPDPIFHGGQAQRLGKRLRLSIDITDKLPLKPNNPVRNRFVDIELNWLHAPLEDQSVMLLDLVGSGQISPLLCHLIGLPVIQVTLDRAYTIADLRTTFDRNYPGGAILDGRVVDGLHGPDITPLMMNMDGSASEMRIGVHGAYDNCIPPARFLSAASVKSALKSKFEASVDEDLCIADEHNEIAEYIPICLLCPLTRTRIELPVRSVRCEHLQCFDLTSYLTINRRRPRWTCPICSTPAPFRDLRLDELFLSILEDSRSASATFVHVDPNGDWRPAPEEGADSQPTTTTSAQAPQSTPISPPLLSGPNLSPVSPVHPEVTAPTVNVSSPKASELPARMRPELISEQSTAGITPCITVTAPVEKDVEVIVLSDDDDDDTLSPPRIAPQPLMSPTKSDSIESSTANCPRPPKHAVQNRAPSVGEKSNSDTIQIDLTNEDSDESMDISRPVKKTISSAPDMAMKASLHSSCKPSAASRLSSPSGLLDDEQLKSNPLIVISPLTHPLNGLDSPLCSGTSEALTPSGSSSTDLEKQLPQPSKTISSHLGRTWAEDLAKSATNLSDGDASYRHLFDKFGSSEQQGSSKHSENRSRKSNTIQQPRTRTDSGGSAKSQCSLSTEKPQTSSSAVPTFSNNTRSSRTESSRIRPVASYLENPSDDVDCVPGLHLSDMSDAEENFLTSTTPVFPGPVSSSRERPGLLKQNQSAALARLIHQRSSRQTATRGAVSNPSRPGRGGATARRSGAGRGSRGSRQSAASKRARRYGPHSRRRRDEDDEEEDEETETSEEDSIFSSEMSCVSASESSEQHSNRSSSKADSDEDSIDSESSDDRWSPSRANSVHTTKRGKRRLLTRR